MANQLAWFLTEIPRLWFGVKEKHGFHLTNGEKTSEVSKRWK